MNDITEEEKREYERLVKKCIKMARLFQNKHGMINIWDYKTCLFMALDNIMQMADEKGDIEVVDNIRQMSMDLIMGNLKDDVLH